ncbi:hypothetical protein [Streptomyces gobiensis]|uniref:hypothetical protein n=1 Tax=Streptomyces gobiensis TaxID=2875706 RepID=UPI001E31BE77|nr:hypothetical protein [Streptomyces gobiensis]UGY94758.1 hypothetical protein test1122_25490 [Streptomyces gobiensis]
MPAPHEPASRGGRLAAVNAGSLMVLCCAGPLLLSGGALGAAGAALGNPWLISVGAGLVLIAIAHTLRCRFRRLRGDAGAEDCCPDAALGDGVARLTANDGRASP